ncbi:MAG: hypothetical protein ACK50J_23080 [Planctomyces sp.]
MNVRKTVVLNDPVVVYTAYDNIEAHLVSVHLNDAGIDASVIEDNSTAGVAVLGVLHNIHRPQVFVGRADVAAATDLVKQYLDIRHAESTAANFCCHCGADPKAESASCSDCGAVPESDTDGKKANRHIGSEMNEHFRRFRKWYAMADLLPMLGMAVFLLIGAIALAVQAIFAA